MAPPKRDVLKTTVYLDRSSCARLDSAAEDCGLSVAELIRLSVRNYLDELDLAKEDGI